MTDNSPGNEPGSLREEKQEAPGGPGFPVGKSRGPVQLPSGRLFLGRKAWGPPLLWNLVVPLLASRRNELSPYPLPGSLEVFLPPPVGVESLLVLAGRGRCSGMPFPDLPLRCLGHTAQLVTGSFCLDCRLLMPIMYEDRIVVGLMCNLSTPKTSKFWGLLFPNQMCPSPWSIQQRAEQHHLYDEPDTINLSIPTALQLLPALHTI